MEQRKSKVGACTWPQYRHLCALVAAGPKGRTLAELAPQGKNQRGGLHRSLKMLRHKGLADKTGTGDAAVWKVTAKGIEEHAKSRELLSQTARNQPHRKATWA
ncbi:hypothetical protein [Nocardia terpenica]|uniref:hypothetical protein n=1 Tax=Nocardia terpenica TaxID=455432 RepID=UPI0012FE53EF|nr:hypothetical protein [Nocardia terpenica]